jgi:acyl-CoA thioesterase I
MLALSPKIRRFFKVVFSALLSFGVFFSAELKAQDPLAPAASPADTQPFWETSEMKGDPLLFIQQAGAPAATAKLLFPATENPHITSMDETQVYELNRDYTWQPGSDTLTLTPNSRIPFKTHEQMFPAVGAPQSFGTATNGKTAVLFEDGLFFYNLHVQARYPHTAKWTGTVPSGPSPYLPAAEAKLKAHEPLKIVMLGDSISVGYSSSSSFNAPPRRPSYFNRVVSYLHEKFGSEITPTNLSVAGRASGWGISMEDKIIAAQPDLVIIAFGMNDGGVASEYLGNLEQVVKATQTACPKAEYILVATMAGNPDITFFPPHHFEEYRVALLAAQRPGVAVADVTSVWFDLIKQKTFADLTGNGVNHPNDFGHEVYADVIETLF